MAGPKLPKQTSSSWKPHKCERSLGDWILIPIPSLFRQCGQAWEVTRTVFFRILVGPSQNESLHFVTGCPLLLLSPFPLTHSKRQVDSTRNNFFPEVSLPGTLSLLKSIHIYAILTPSISPLITWTCISRWHNRLDLRLISCASLEVGSLCYNKCISCRWCRHAGQMGGRWLLRWKGEEIGD